MHKTGANEGGSANDGERQPLFEMPRRPAGQKILLGLEVLPAADRAITFS